MADETFELPLQPENAIISKIEAVFKEDSRIAVAVAKCESSLNPKRIGDTDRRFFSYGLFQINQEWWNYSAETLLSADENIRIAYEIFLKHGWWKWSCFSQNYYKKYL